MVIDQDKHKLWTQLCEIVVGSHQIQEECMPIMKEAASSDETMRFFLDKTIGLTNDSRMVDVMELLLAHGGARIVKADDEFRRNLMKKAQMHENQFVVIYEDWTAAEAYLNVYRMLEEIG